MHSPSISLYLAPCPLTQKPLATSRSGPPHGKDKIGGAVPGSYRAFNGCRQPRISPVAREKQIFPICDGAWPQRILPRRRLKCGAALTHDLPRGQFALHATGLADIPPDRLSELLTRHIHQPVSTAYRDRQPLREREQ